MKQFAVDEPVVIARLHPRHGDNIKRYHNTIATIAATENKRVCIRLMNGIPEHIDPKYLDRATDEQLASLPGGYQARQAAKELSGSQRLALKGLEEALIQCAEAGLSLRIHNASLYAVKRTNVFADEPEVFEVNTGECEVHGS